MLKTLSSARQGIHTKLKRSPLCQLLSGLRKPLSDITGGMVPAEKTPHPEEQAQAGPSGTAAQIKAAALEAPKRQTAIRELQGVDVRYHPEAEKALVAALRTDPSECVRYDAARTLTTLPVCTKAIADALQVCVEGSHRDGNPGELSPRVRIQAEAALAHCQQCLPPGDVSDQERPEYPAIPASPNNPPTGQAAVIPASSIGPLESDTGPTLPPSKSLPPVQNRPRNLAEVIRTARQDR